MGWLRAVDAWPAVLVGHDLGGGVAQADPFQRLPYGQRLARDLDAPLVTLDGARPFVPEDRPDPLAAAVEQVAAEARSAP